MTAPYSFSLLRYVHDVVGGEFVNIGVALYAPDYHYVGARCTRRYARLSNLFVNVDGRHFRLVVDHLEHKINERQRLMEGFQFEQPAVDVCELLQRVLPPDDSSIQFSEPRGGLTDDPEATLKNLFERFIGQYEVEHPRGLRDEEVWRFYRNALREANIDQYLQPHTIRGRDYEYQFSHTWMNGQINAAEAISFDLVDSESIKDKANKWLGRMVSLKEANQPFTIYFLLGRPRRNKLRESYAHAQNILRKSPLKPELIEEDDAADLVEAIRKDLEL